MFGLYNVSFDENDRIVKAVVSGKPTHEDHLAARKEASRLCSEKKCSKLMVDLSNLDTEHSSTMDCFSFGASFADELPHIQVAYILPKEKKSASDVWFTTTVQKNRGINCKEFEDINEARRWLLEKT